MRCVDIIPSKPIGSMKAYVPALECLFGGERGNAREQRHDDTEKTRKIGAVGEREKGRLGDWGTGGERGGGWGV